MNDFIEYLNDQILALRHQVEELHFEEWKRPAGQHLLREIDRFAVALQIAQDFANGKVLVYSIEEQPDAANQ